jgi:hypothetical protein
MLVGLCIKPPLQHAKFSRMREAPAIQKSAKAKSGWLNAEQPAFFSSQKYSSWWWHPDPPVIRISFMD